MLYSYDEYKLAFALFIINQLILFKDYILSKDSNASNQWKMATYLVGVSGAEVSLQSQIHYCRGHGVYERRTGHAEPMYNTFTIWTYEEWMLIHRTYCTWTGYEGTI